MRAVLVREFGALERAAIAEMPDPVPGGMRSWSRCAPHRSITSTFW